MATGHMKPSAIPQLLEGAGVNDGRKALEVAKTKATTRDKVVKLLLMIGVPAGLIAGVGSMIALNKSDGSLGNENKGPDPSALVINEPSATGNVAALVTDINKDVAATTTLVSTTTPPTKTAAATGAGLEGGDNPNAIPDNLTKVDEVLAYAEENGASKAELKQALARCDDWSPKATEALIAFTGNSKYFDERSTYQRYHSLLERVEGYPKSYRVMEKDDWKDVISVRLVTSKEKYPQKDGSLAYRYFAGIQSQSAKSAPEQFVRSGMFNSLEDAESQLDAWVQEYVKPTQNLLASKE